MSSTTQGAEIRYTLDGTTPTASVGTVYAGPITISTTTPLRAVASAPGMDDSRVLTHSYFFVEDVLQQPNDPDGYPSQFAEDDGDGPYPSDYEMDSEILEHPNNDDGVAAGAMGALPSLSIVTDIAHLFDAETGIYFNPNEKGRLWEREVSLEWLDPAGATLSFAAQAGLRIHGQSSRRPYRQPKKNLRVKFRSEYGTTDLDYPLFSQVSEHVRPALSFESLVFKGGGNRAWSSYDRDLRRRTDYLNDEWVRRSHLEMGGLSPHGNFAHLYLNGLYWGLYNVIERLDEDFYASYLGGDADTEFEVIVGDEEFDNLPTASAGTIDAYNAVIALVNGVTTVDDALLADVATRVDLEGLADYMILTHYTGKTDWPEHNWNVYRKTTGADTRFKFSSWDNDSAFNKVDEDVSTNDDEDSPIRIYLRLLTHPEFRLLVGDRLQKHLFHGGALSPEQGLARYQALVSDIDQAVIGESARWGDYSRDNYNKDIVKNRPAYLYTRDFSSAESDPDEAVSDSQQMNWLQVVGGKVDDYLPNRGEVLLDQYRNNGWYDDGLAEPEFSQHGGEVGFGFELTLSNPDSNGDLFYTTDGSDPRLAGGAVADGAVNGGDSTTISISEALVTVKARVRDGSEWSYLVEFTFQIPTATPLVITEINYQDGSIIDADDWVEIYNPASNEVDVSGWTLDDTDPTASFVIPDSTAISAGGYLVIAADPQAFASAHPAVTAPVVGGLQFGLSGSDSVVLRDPSGVIVDVVDYLAASPWPTLPDGSGPTLCLIDADSDNASFANWTSSPATGGSPGAAIVKVADNERPSIAITSPAQDSMHADGAEIDVTVTAADADGSIAKVTYFVDALDGLGSQAIAETTSPPFTLQNWSPSSGFYRLGAIVTDNSGAEAVAEEVNLQVGPTPVLVINEINYKSSTAMDSGDWIEIHNPSSNSVNLGNWSLRDSDPNNARYQFSKQTVIAANGFVLVVKEPALFPVVHPGVSFQSKNLGFGLGGGGDSVTLFNPVETLIDHVVFTAEDPWPTPPAGTGPTLSLLSPSLDNALPESWVSSSELGGTPGSRNVSQGADNDAYDDLLEAYLNMDPTVDDHELPVTGKVTEQGFVLQYTRATNLDLGEGTVQGKVEWSEDTITWWASGERTSSGTQITISESTTPIAGRDAETVDALVSTGGESVFLRILVTLQL